MADKTLHIRALARAAQVLADVEALASRLGISQAKLKAYLEGVAPLPQVLFLKVVDIVTDEQRQSTAAARDVVQQSLEVRRQSELARQVAAGARRRAGDVLSRAAAGVERSKKIRARLLDDVATLMRSEAASMQVLYAENDALLLVAWKGFHPDSAAHWQRVAVGTGSTCGVALKERQRVIVADVNDPTCGLTQEGIADYKLSGLVAVQSTPLVSCAGRVLGMLSTHWRRVHQPTERDLARFDVLARQAADVLEGVHT